MMSSGIWPSDVEEYSRTFRKRYGFHCQGCVYSSSFNESLRDNSPTSGGDIPEDIADSSSRKLSLIPAKVLTTQEAEGFIWFNEM
jgi:hypothetical protein